MDKIIIPEGKKPEENKNNVKTQTIYLFNNREEEKVDGTTTDNKT